MLSVSRTQHAWRVAKYAGPRRTITTGLTLLQSYKASTSFPQEFEYMRIRLIEVEHISCETTRSTTRALSHTNQQHLKSFPTEFFAPVPNPKHPMADFLLDIPVIRKVKPKNLIVYFNKLRETTRNSAFVVLCLKLWSENSSPQGEPEIIVLCMNYPSSRTIRQLGIKFFGKALLKPEKWELAWRSAGETPGLVEYLAKVAVIDVTAFSVAVRGGRGGRRIPAKEQAIEQLICALLPSHYPESSVKSPEKRPVQDHYAELVHACSAKFVRQLLEDQDQSNPLYRNLRPLRLLKSHVELTTERSLAAIFDQGKHDNGLLDYVKAFCSNTPSEQSVQPHISSPMAFSMKMLRSRLEDRENMYWPEHLSEAQLYKDLLRRSIKRQLPKDKLIVVFALGLNLLQKNPNLKSEVKSSIIWNELATRWRYSPKDYQELFAQAMRLDLGPSIHNVCSSVMSLSGKLKLPPPRLWDLLHLFCLHTPKLKNSAGSVVDLKNTLKTVDLKPLGYQKWSTKLFFTLEKHHAIVLLESLQMSFPQNNFLSGPHKSILSGDHDSTNRTPILLTTLLQRDSYEEQVKVKAIVDEFRKKAAASREQTDRAAFAIAALQHSISSGDLDLYGETVTWSERFIRDLLTIKAIYDSDIVLATEGVELLSGISDPLPAEMTLEEVAERVGKANTILMTFHEHMLLAKREPSYQQRDWEDVRSLFGSAIKKRVARAKSVHQRLLASEADVYTAIWAKTLALIETVDVDFLGRVIAKSMLESGTERRKQKDRQPGDDLLEELSYKFLIRVVKGDKPELARQLVLNTILERPDASSWHRQFLSPGLMRSLTAEQAQEMLLAFATAIGEKLEEQSYVKVGEALPASSAPPQSIVKVTTIKYLSQLLDNADFISADAATEVLVEIFKVSTHRDIRLATLNSLFGILNTLGNGPRSNPMIEKILEALDTVVPVVGSINESRPPQDKEWKEAQETNKFPEVSDCVFNPPPLMGAILEAPFKSPGVKNLSTEFVNRFFLPIYSLSVQEQSKWTTLFLAKYMPEIKISELPRVPISVKMWPVLLKYTDVLPKYVLEDYNAYTTSTINPPSTLLALNKALRENIGTLPNPEIPHWLSLFGANTPNYFDSGTSELIRIISSIQTPSLLSTDGVTPARIQDLIVSQASLILDSYKNHIPFWTDLTLSLQHPHVSTHPSLPLPDLQKKVLHWQTHIRPILTRLSTILLHKKQQVRSNGTFDLLPSHDLLSYSLLPFPSPTHPKPSLSEACENLAEKLQSQLHLSLSSPQGINALRWPRVLEDTRVISPLLNSHDERLHVASFIGKLSPYSADVNEDKAATRAVNLVKVGVAIHLLDGARDGIYIRPRPSGEGGNEKVVTDEEGWKAVVTHRLKEMVSEWLYCGDEEVREMAGEWVREDGGVWARILKGVDGG